MKTNQIMTVTLLDGTLEIGHLDMFGDLNALFIIGNRHRTLLGLPLIRVEIWRTLTGVKEFIERVGIEIGEPALRTKAGKSGGIKAHLYILLDAAAYLSADLKLEMYKKFVEGKLLEWRDRSGDNFIELNASLALNAIDVLGKDAHKGHFITLAKSIKNRCEVEDWNLATPQQLRLRTHIEESLSTMLKVGVVKDWEHLKKLSENV
jgi:hypothetical protein